ncbi:MAG: hypothetical protein H7A51_03435 [Akkermansiaceae bacterium]|nr:hypothetical protein [Akkermansiaceae bacterium]
MSCPVCGQARKHRVCPSCLYSAGKKQPGTIAIRHR